MSDSAPVGRSDTVGYPASATPQGVADLVRLAGVAREHAVMMHGGRYHARFGHLLPHVTDDDEVLLDRFVRDLRNETVRLASRRDPGPPGRPPPDLAVMDGGFLFAEPGTPAQDWHLDSWDYFLVASQLVQGVRHTEFMDTPYVEIGEESSPEILRSAGYPARWQGTPAAPALVPDTPGTCTTFVSTCIHRAPAVPRSQVEDRVVLYVAFQDRSRPTGRPDSAELPVFQRHWDQYTRPDTDSEPDNTEPDTDT
jgi:hypothetical protein